VVVYRRAADADDGLRVVLNDRHLAAG
jgi:hypothetical protein